MADLPYQANRNAIWRYVFSVDIFTFIFRFWLLMYTTPHCCCIKNFLRSLHKKRTKNTKIIGGGGQYSPLRVMTH